MGIRMALTAGLAVVACSGPAPVTDASGLRDSQPAPSDAANVDAAEPLPDAGTPADAALPCFLREPPATMTTIAPGQDLAAIVANAPIGTTFFLQRGIHRLRAPIAPRAGDTFLGEVDPVACTLLTVVRGSRTAEFAPTGATWTSTSMFARNVGPTTVPCAGPLGGPSCEDGRHCFHYTEVHARRGGDWLRLEPVVSAPSPGTFRQVGAGIGPIELGEDPSAFDEIEVSEVPHAFAGTPGADNVTIADLVVEFFATPTDEGAIGGIAAGASWKIEDVEVRHVHAAGVRLGSLGQLWRGYLHHNGQLGLTSEGTHGAASWTSEISANGVAGYCPTWASGGVRLRDTSRAWVFEACVRDHSGRGVWLQSRNYDAQIGANIVARNQVAGIVHESGSLARIVGNLAAENGLAASAPPALDGPQIGVIQSDSVDIYGNLLFVPAAYGNGITFVWSRARETANCCPVGDNSCVHQPCRLSYVRAHENDTVFLGGNSQSGAGFDTDIGKDIETRSAVYQGNGFYSNRYYATSPDARHFAWGGPSYSLMNRTIQQFQAMGQEPGLNPLMVGNPYTDMEQRLNCRPRSRR